MGVHTLLLSYGKEFEATLEISGACSLYDLAELSIEALGFDLDHAFGFYDKPDDPYGSEVKYTLFADMGEGDDEGGSVKKIKVAELFTPGTAMCFLFDYGDDWRFRISCRSVDSRPRRKQMRKVIKRKGSPPEQYPSLDEDEF